MQISSSCQRRQGLDLTKYEELNLEGQKVSAAAAEEKMLDLKKFLTSSEGAC